MKYVHLLPINSPIFNEEYIKLINNNFDMTEHTFFLRYPLKEIQNKYLNCILDEKCFEVDSLKKIEKEYDYIFMHSKFYSNKEILKIKKNTLRKIVWCVWGHDLYERKKSLSKIQSLKHKVKIIIMKFARVDKVISQFKAIVIGYKADELMIRKKYGSSVKILNALYGSGYYKEDIDKIVLDNQKTDDTIHIMIGHSAFDFLQHKKYLDLLSQYRNENIKIVLILSYGSKQYAEEIEEYAKSIYKDKVLIIKEFINSLEYIKLLNTIDIAIFDYEHQAAFGNIIVLMYLCKKLYLSPTGVMFKGLSAEDIPIYSCNEIKNASFDEFCSRELANYNREYVNNLLDKNHLIQQWSRVFEYLSSKSGRE